jgi:hypothetical protein
MALLAEAGALIPIISIVMGIGIAALAVVCEFARRRHIVTLHHQERMAAIEKGLELPPIPDAFFGVEHKPASRHGNLLGGLVLNFVGATLFVALYHASGLRPALFALVPWGIGVALLIFYYAVEKRELSAEKSPDNPRA